MLRKKQIKKIIYLKKILKQNSNNDLNNLKKSIIQNNQIKQLKKYYITILLNNFNSKKIKKNCLFSISTKGINKKIKFSRFAVHQINFNNNNQNYKILNK